MPSSTALWSFYLVLFITSLHEVRFSHANGHVKNATDIAKMVPKSGQIKTKILSMMMMNESRRKLNSFQICALCTCCGGASKSYCVPSPCCYAINCNIPNRPFGFCSFTPKTCNCFGCHL